MVGCKPRNLVAHGFTSTSGNRVGLMPIEAFTAAELLATQDAHNADHDGYCTCSDDGTALYEVEHLLDVMRKARQK